jgi:hypothetical protein
MSSKTRRFIPRLVALDDRCLPAVTFNLVGTTLIVTGDNSGNTITITDTGTASGISVVGDGASWSAATPVSAIVVTTGTGNDVVEYDLVGPLTTTRLLSASLGRGNDTFTANLHGQTISGSSTNLGISVNTGPGKDTTILNAQGATVDASAHMSLNVIEGPGKDTTQFNYDPHFLDLGNVTLTAGKHLRKHLRK